MAAVSNSSVSMTDAPRPSGARSAADSMLTRSRRTLRPLARVAPRARPHFTPNSQPDLCRHGGLRQEGIAAPSEWFEARAVEDLADAMGVSRITVYNYLNAIHR